MDYQQYQKDVQQLIADEIELWENNKKKWTVSNQFDEYVLRSAMMQLNKIKVATEVCEFFKHTDPTVMDIAYYCSDFQAPQIASAWVD